MTLSMNRGNDDFGGRVIFNYQSIKRRMTITIEEFKALIDYYPYGHPHRIAFLLMGCCGLRNSEVSKLKITDFSKNCESLTYTIRKKGNTKVYKTGTISKNYKTRTVKLFDSLRKEVYWYLENNYHMFKNRQIFGFNKDSLRRYLGKLRKKAREGKITNPVLKNLLLEREGSRYGYNINVQPAYRFALHSFRRFFLTYFYHVKANKDLVYTQLEIGHSLKETTMIYIRRAEDIGLTDKLIEKKISFESIFYGKSQTVLEEFI